MPEPGRPDARGRAALGADGGVVVVAAMREEIRPLDRRFAAIETWADGRVACRRGRLRGLELVTAATGDGFANAERGLRRVVEHYRPAAVLVVGLGGALSPDLEVGDLVLSTEVRDGERELAPPDDAWLAAADAAYAADAANAADAGRRDAARWRPGQVVTVDRILLSAGAKSRCWRACGSRRPAVADLESAAYARVANERRLPYLVARAVSDRADESLPAFLAGSVGGGGGIDRRRVVLQALTRPSSWPALLRLRSRMNHCAERLADAAERLATVRPRDR